MSDFNELLPESQQFFELSGTSRYGKWRIDVPPFADTDKFLDILKTIIPAALDECDPRIRRANANVKFVPEIIPYKGGDQLIKGGGNANYKKNPIGVGTIDIAESI